MRNSLVLASLVVLTATTATTGCSSSRQGSSQASSGTSRSSQSTAATNIAQGQSGYAEGGAPRRAAVCFGREAVRLAGVEQLQRDGILDKKLRWTLPHMGMMMLPPTSARAMAEASVTCQDPARVRAMLLQISDAKAVDAYVRCIHKIPRADRVEVMVHSYTHNQQSPRVAKTLSAQSACQTPFAARVHPHKASGQPSRTTAPGDQHGGKHGHHMPGMPGMPGM